LHDLRLAAGHAQGSLQRLQAVPEAPPSRQGIVEVQRGWERAFDKAFDQRGWR
jgi:hypothetical protein